MGENRTYKMLSVIALVLGVVGVTLGYAAFSNTLTINSEAEVTPDSSKFNVDFSTSTASVVADPVVPTLNPTGVTGFTATSGTISNASDPVINNIKATFTEPGQKATYQFYAYNAGEYIAYLKSITFNGTKTCAAVDPVDGATDALVQSACAGISLTVTVGSETFKGYAATNQPAGWYHRRSHRRLLPLLQNPGGPPRFLRQRALRVPLRRRKK